MSDEADMTQERMDNEAELRRKYTTPPPLEAEAIGKCLNCGEEFSSTTKRWCDEHCARDWTRRQQRRL